jgi:hypothetical protein
MNPFSKTFLYKKKDTILIPFAGKFPNTTYQKEILPLLNSIFHLDLITFI